MDCRTFSLLLDTPEAERTPEQVREMEAHAAECSAQLRFAVAVGAGGVEIAHAAVIGFAQQAHGFLFRDALYGQCAERVLDGGYTSRPERDGVHYALLSAA